MTQQIEQVNTDLVPVHGGLDAPVDRVVPLKDRKKFLAEAEGLPRLRVNRADESTVVKIEAAFACASNPAT